MSIAINQQKENLFLDQSVRKTGAGHLYCFMRPAFCKDAGLFVLTV